ncbi:MAG TPA: hypothetical protein VGS97_28575 [Actinocrinis sp.]|uniref:hypothetical protein n=1 Tax=Actinocrinis sp. TaxID=1920516 RepID=UPI002DDCCE00|nr:hypothetical protein [Actinocrinis sp.]HEV2348076.1 hypothetical protein [Actinocrinis sp.]
MRTVAGSNGTHSTQRVERAYRGAAFEQTLLAVFVAVRAGLANQLLRPLHVLSTERQFE